MIVILNYYGNFNYCTTTGIRCSWRQLSCHCCLYMWMMYICNLAHNGTYMMSSASDNLLLINPSVELCRSFLVPWLSLLMLLSIHVLSRTMLRLFALLVLLIFNWSAMQSFAVLILCLDQTIQSLNGLMNNQQNSESAHLIMSHMRRFIDLNVHATQPL